MPQHMRQPWDVTLPDRFRLIVIRHAQTPANIDGTFCGTQNPDLTDTGRRMAGYLTQNPLLAGVEQVIASPTRRARETGQVIVDAFGLSPLKTDPRLCELAFGDWEGCSPHDIYSSATYHHWSENPFERAPPGGETGAAVLERTLAAIVDGLTESRSLAIVSHKTPVRLLTAYFGRGVLPDFRKMSGFWVTSVTCISFNGPSYARIVGPSVVHLPVGWQRNPDRFSPNPERENNSDVDEA